MQLVLRKGLLIEYGVQGGQEWHQHREELTSNIQRLVNVLLIQADYKKVVSANIPGPSKLFYFGCP